MSPVENREGRRRCPRCRTLYREGERHGCSPLSDLTVRERDVVAAVLSWARTCPDKFDEHASLRLINAVDRLKQERRGAR